jgi:sulfide:quinone oxidoreductase
MENNGHRSGRQKVLIAGGGVAGLEAALALRDLAGERVEIQVHDPRREFVFRPFAVAEPYGANGGFRYDMRRLCERCGASFGPGAIVAIDAERRLATTHDGGHLPYDHMIVATGVRMLWAVPGAVTFWGAADEGQVGDVIAALRAGVLERVVFTMPGGHSWTLPLYELALLGARELEGIPGSKTKIAIATPEELPLELFGRRVGECMSELLAERGIEVYVGARPIKFENGRLRIAAGEEIEADAAVSLPRLEGRRIGGAPHDGGGFVGVDEHGRVIGQERLYAAGDITSFPVKQGGIACQQADAVAEAIAAAAGAEVDPQPFDPILRGVLWTGRKPRYLYGRLAGGYGETSSFSTRPQGLVRAGKVTARHLTPLVDELVAEAATSPGVGSEAVA